MPIDKEVHNALFKALKVAFIKGYKAASAEDEDKMFVLICAEMAWRNELPKLEESMARAERIVERELTTNNEE